MIEKSVYEMGKPVTPDLVVWELTLKCNLKCIHCGSTAGKPRKNELTTKEALKLCRDLSTLGFKGIALMGGEVFLRNDWEIISREIKDQDIVLSIITNGFHNPNDIIPRLVRLNIDSILVGFDGSSPGIHDYIRGIEGSFEKTLNFIHAAKKANLDIGVITTVHTLNFHELPKIKEWVLREEMSWQIQEATPIGRFPNKMILSSEEYYSLALFILYNQKKYRKKGLSIVGAHNFGFHSNVIPNLSMYPIWNGCYAGKSILGIQSNGNVKGCLALPDEYIEDNIRNRSIIDIWNDPDSFSYNRKFDVKDLGENCKGCKYGKNCKGGCMTRSVSITNNPHNDPYCFYRLEKEGLI